MTATSQNRLHKARFTISEHEEFKVYPSNGEFPDKGGVYIFCVLVADTHPQHFRPLYVGRTKSLKNRIQGDHDEWEAAIELGMTHILVDFEQDKFDQEFLEGFYIGFYDPPLND